MEGAGRVLLVRRRRGGGVLLVGKRRDVLVPCRMVLASDCCKKSGREQVFEEVDGGDEIALPDGHDQVDGVEIALAAKATPEVGTRVDCRVEFFAVGAEKAPASLAQLVGPLQLIEEAVNGDVIAKVVKVFLAKSFGHDFSSF
jgi:hypothetical protein